MPELGAPKIFPLGADAELISPNGDVTVEDALKIELVLDAATAELEAAPNTGGAPNLLACVCATDAVPLLVAPKAEGLPELAVPNAGT